MSMVHGSCTGAHFFAAPLCCTVAINFRGRAIDAERISEIPNVPPLAAHIWQ